VKRRVAVPRKRKRISKRESQSIARRKVYRPNAILRKVIRRKLAQRQVILYRLRVNGAGSFQMADPNSRQRHWEPLVKSMA